MRASPDSRSRSRPITTERDPQPPIRISYVRYVAEAPECGALAGQSRAISATTCRTRTSAAPRSAISRPRSPIRPTCSGRAPMTPARRRASRRGLGEVRQGRVDDLAEAGRRASASGQGRELSAGSRDHEQSKPDSRGRQIETPSRELATSGRAMPSPMSDLGSRAADSAHLDPGVLRDAATRPRRCRSPPRIAGSSRRTSACTWAASPAAVAHYQESPTPNLIVIEIVAAAAASCSASSTSWPSAATPAPRSIVIGHANDVLLYRELLKRGVSEYLVAPVTPLQLMESISNLYNDPDADPVGHVFAFIGAKGGVGSSTICHNVAWTLSEMLQASVVIADLDLAFGTAGLDFNQDPVQGIAEALVEPGASRRGAARPPADEVLGAPAHLRGARSCSTATTTSRRTPATSSSTSCARTCPTSPSTCRTCGRRGRSASCCRPTRS